MIDLRIVRQTFDFDCGAKALQAVMEYYGVEMREDEILDELKADQNGTNYADMIALAKKKGFQIFAADGVSLEEVQHFIDDGKPVIVLVQAWADKYMTLEEWKSDYEDGHYVVVIGYENNIIIFEDPASPRRTWMTEEEFLVRWHDKDARTGKKLQNFAMVLLGKEPITRVPEHMD
jgi:predicted double-glycine peptidase